jgi:hypothetical protein
MFLEAPKVDAIILSRVEVLQEVFETMVVDFMLGVVA